MSGRGPAGTSMVMDEARGLEGISRSFLSVGVLHALTALAQFVALVILARQLTDEAFGRIGFVFMLSQLIPSLSALGAQVSTVRLLGSRDLGDWAWKPFFFRAVALCGALAFVAAVACGQLYLLAHFEVGCLAVACAARIVLIHGAALLKVHESFLLAITLDRGAHMWILALIVFHGSQSAPDAALALALGTTLQCIVGLVVLLSLPSGPAPIPSGVFRDGVAVLLHSGAANLIANSDRLVLARLVPHAALGAYLAIHTLMRGYTLLQQVLLYLLIPKLRREPSLSPRHLWLPLLLVTALITAAYMLVGSALAHHVYGARYDNVAYLIYPFMLAQIVLTLHALPLGLTQARASRGAVLRLGLLTALLAAASPLLYVPLILHFRGLGAAVGAIVMYLALYVLTSWCVPRERPDAPQIA